MKRKNILKVETIIALIIVVLCVAIWLANQDAWTMNTVFNMLRSAIVPGIFAMGVLMVLISGGIDVSFTYIAVVAAYTSVVVLNGLGYEGSILVPFLLAAVIGTLLGMVNGFLIAKFDFPAMIVTLGTGTAFQGMAICFVGTEHITDLPGQMVELSRTNLLSVDFADGSKGGINICILITAAVLILGWFLLQKTMWGRGLYAIGGSKVAAERIGYNVKRILFSLYALVGGLAGIAGIIFMSLNRQANPHLMVGTELDIIAAVVLGGASVSGGKGTVWGSILGIGLITILNNSLILVGIPSQWQKALIGAVILIGTALPVLLAAINRRRGSRVAAKQEKGRCS